jgi:nucleotidyltransferase/DNA polymerase involved in DNA repair
MMHKLYQVNIFTIDDIVTCDPNLLHAYLGKWGDVLWSIANGFDQSPVATPTDEAYSPYSNDYSMESTATVLPQ